MSSSDQITAYRPCVGIMLLNPQGLVWIGRRFEKQNDDGVGHWWQMPQGGIDEGEDLHAAALRELQEETGITSATLIAENPRWLTYDLPEALIGKSWGGKYRGQKQKWLALRFTGNDSEITLKVPGHKQEFDHWRWAHIDELMALIIPFKRQVYAEVIKDFRHLAR